MRPSPLAALLLLSSALSAQAFVNVEFTEVLVDPVGPNANAQLVEVINSGNTIVDFTGWYLVTSTGAYAMPTAVLPLGGIALLHLGQGGSSTATDIFLPGVPTLAATSSLALFRTANVTSPSDLVDFVSWGGGQGAIATAVLAGQWPSAQDTVVLPAIEGHTIAHYDAVAYGSRSRPEAWFDDGSPTLGAENDGGGIFVGAYGCPQMTFPPQIGSGEENNRPWIGETWRLDVGYLPTAPTMMWVAFGTSTLGSLPLDPFGIPGCFFEVSPDATLVRAMPASLGQLLVALPNDPGFIGIELLLQGLVLFPGANSANLLPTRVVHAFLGDR